MQDVAGRAVNPPDELRVFISYRRSDCQAQANGLHDGLRHRLPGARVFMDIDSIPFGVDFEEHIRDEIKACDVVLVLVGDNWLEPVDATGRRRIDEPADFVRLEIESALQATRVRVVPVLVEDARMPAQTELPDSIQKLARLNAIELSDKRWQADLERLAGVVERMASQPPPAPAVTSMRLDHVEAAAVAAAVDGMPSHFQTKDISEHVDVQRAHGVRASARNYHAMIGSYISRNCQELSVRSLGKSSNGRGERWERLPAARRSEVAPLQPVRVQPQPSPAWGPAHPPSLPQYLIPPPSPAQRAASGVSVVMMVLPAVTFGFGAWIPPAWAMAQTKDLPDQRQRARRFLVGTIALLILFFIMLMIPADENGDSPMWVAVPGVLSFFGAIGLGTTAAVIFRGSGAAAAQRRFQAHITPVPAALAARQARQQYRELAERDPRLAREMAVGMPDRPRPFDDGGLLDLNRLSEECLVRYARLGQQEAQKTVAVRERFGRLSSVDELVVHADVDPPTADLLREYAIFT